MHTLHIWHLCVQCNSVDCTTRLDSRQSLVHIQSFVHRSVHRLFSPKLLQTKSIERLLLYVRNYLFIHFNTRRIKVIYTLLVNPYSFYHLLIVASAILGVVYSPFFFSVGLLDIIIRSESLKNVLRAVTTNGQALIMTAVLGVIVIYYFTIIGYLTFPNRYDIEIEYGGSEYRCDTMLSCLLTHINDGLRGGGIGDVLPKPSIYDPAKFYGSFIFELAFFFVVIILILNMIFGIILDTFAALRDTNAEKEEDINNFCFICSLHR